jgi:hypothetical protein
LGIWCIGLFRLFLICITPEWQASRLLADFAALCLVLANQTTSAGTRAASKRVTSFLMPASLAPAIRAEFSF